MHLANKGWNHVFKNRDQCHSIVALKENISFSSMGRSGSGSRKSGEKILGALRCDPWNPGCDSDGPLMTSPSLLSRNEHLTGRRRREGLWGQRQEKGPVEESKLQARFPQCQGKGQEGSMGKKREDAEGEAADPFGECKKATMLHSSTALLLLTC